MFLIIWKDLGNSNNPYIKDQISILVQLNVLINSILLIKHQEKKESFLFFPLVIMELEVQLSFILLELKMLKVNLKTLLMQEELIMEVIFMLLKFSLELKMLLTLLVGCKMVTKIKLILVTVISLLYRVLLEDYL